MVDKREILFFAVLFSIFISLNFVSAHLNTIIPTPNYINRTANTLINFNITNTGNTNITQVLILLPQGATFYAGSNGTTNETALFSNTTLGGFVYLNWTNTTSAGFQGNNSFWFNVSLTTAGDNIFTVTTNSTTKITNNSAVSVTVNFAFSGYVRNETGGLQNLTNVTMYQFVMGQNGPPTERAVASVIANGTFNFTSINSSAQQFILKMIFYNSSGIATKVGSVLPAFPAMMYYPQSADFDMSLDNSTFYLVTAATLRLNATNSSTGQKFGYEVIDQKVGFPVVSNVKGGVSTIDVIVPTGKAYTVMFLREFSQFQMSPNCNTAFMNDSDCPAPPRSNSTLPTLTEGKIVQVIQDLSVTNIRLIGCIRIAQGHNSTSLISYNITNLVPKLQPWAGFIPPVKADKGDINLTLDINYSFAAHPECNRTLSEKGIAWYNISLMGGVSYMIEVYAKNDSGEGNAGGLYLIGLQNISTNGTGIQYQNITLYNPAGQYWSGGLGAVNTSTMRINVQNASGAAITNSLHMEAIMKNTEAGIGTVHYIIESTANGTFYLPILNNSNWVKVSVFANDAPPMQKILNLSAKENNISLISVEFDQTGDKGFRKMNASGDLAKVDVNAMPIQMRFLRAGTEQVITSMTGKDFNPMKALVAGNIDLEIKITTTNVTMKFRNFDMFSAKQPPMFAVMDNNTLGGSTGNWQFGNFVPKEVYDNVTLTIPYSSDVNDSWTYNMKIPVLYQERQDKAQQLEVAWNVSAGYSTANLTDEFIAYNDSRYRSYMTSTGVDCDKTNNTDSVCYINLSAKTITMEIPHFSAVGPSVTGTAPASSTSTTTTSTGGGSVSSGWIRTYIEDKKDLSVLGSVNIGLGSKERVRLLVGNETHYVGVVGLTTTTATINVSSTKAQQAALKAGEEAKFDITDDDYYDILVKLNKITGLKANFTISSINEKVSGVTTTGTGENVAANATAPATNVPITSPGEKSNVGTIIFIVILIILIVGAIIWFVMRNKRLKYYGLR